jgi:hypothetical protein
MLYYDLNVKLKITLQFPNPALPFLYYFLLMGQQQEAIGLALVSSDSGGPAAQASEFPPRALSSMCCVPWAETHSSSEPCYPLCQTKKTKHVSVHVQKMTSVFTLGTEADLS